MSQAPSGIRSNLDAWNSLPPHLQSIVTVAAKAVNQDLLDEYSIKQEALKDLITNHDVQLRELPEDELMNFDYFDEILETSLPMIRM